MPGAHALTCGCDGCATHAPCHAPLIVLELRARDRGQHAARHAAQLLLCACTAKEVTLLSDKIAGVLPWAGSSLGP